MLKNNKLIFLVAGILIFLVRIAGDMFLYSLDFTRGDSSLYWHYITTFTIFLSFAIYYLINVFAKDDNKLYDNFGDNFLNSIYQNFILSFIFVLLLIFFSFKDTSALFKRSYIGLILSDLLFLYFVIVILYNLQFPLKWLWKSRHKLTRFYITFISFLIIIILLNETSELFFKSSFSEWTNTITSVAYILLILIFFLINKKNNWIANLNRPQKNKFFWLFMINILLAIKILMETQNSESLVFNSYNSVFPLTLPLLKISFLFYGIYIFRLFMFLLAVMPTTVIVERKSSGLNSLAYLNKIIAESSNNSKKNLIDTFTNLALQASSANGAWTEIYENDKVLVHTCIHIQPNIVAELHNKYQISEYFKAIIKSNLVESVREEQELSNLQNIISDAKSLIIVPLYTSSRREGTLIVFDKEEYAFEQDELSILSVFENNVRIALENERLIRESVEKERYKNEMLLARNMQQKLLPQKIPSIFNYSIAAFSIPATEVGGDYYDIVKLKNGDDCILIADVSGKGITAAFYMAQLKGVVLSKALESNSVVELLCNINSVLYKKIESQMFITMSAVTINNNNNEIHIARAGHMPFLLKSPQKVDKIIPKGIGIGLAKESFFNSNIEEINIDLKDDDYLIMFTDGLNEIRNKDGLEFGFDELTNFINTNNAKNVDDFVQNVKKMINDYSENTKHFDDITFIAIKKIIN